MATKTFDQVLEEVNKEYNWPVNPKAAARVGAEAYRRFIQPELDSLQKANTDLSWQLYLNKMGI